MSPFFRRRRPAARPGPPPDDATRVLPAEPAVGERRTEVVDETVPVERRPRRDPLWPWMLLLLLLVLAGLGALWYFSRDEPKTTVPDVVGQRVGEATRLVEEAELEPRIVREANERAAGTVFATRPGAGSQLAEGEELTLLVSRGPEQVDVPSVVGLTLDDARARLERVDLEVRVRRVFSEEAAGAIVAQSPAAGERADAGSEVRINVSKGSGRVSVPDLVGLTEEEARSRLEGLDLEARSFEVASDEAAGTVIAQNPLPGDELAEGDSVRINVSTGEGGDGGTGTTTGTDTTGTETTGTETTGGTGTTGGSRAVTVPSVVGRQLAAARGRLADAGFGVRVEYVSSSERAGTVVAQRPAAGASARRGAAIALEVSQGPDARPARAVPDVLGLTQPEATAELRRAGFRVETVGEPTPDAAEEGVVIRQTPAAGRRVSTGALVTIFVGELIE